MRFSLCLSFEKVKITITSGIEMNHPGTHPKPPYTTLASPPTYPGCSYKVSPQQPAAQEVSPWTATDCPHLSAAPRIQAQRKVSSTKAMQGNLPFPSVAEASCKCLIDLKINTGITKVSWQVFILLYFWL
jgi:hypothetical protein